MGFLCQGTTKPSLGFVPYKPHGTRSSHRKPEQTHCSGKTAWPVCSEKCLYQEQTAVSSEVLHLVYVSTHIICNSKGICQIDWFNFTFLQNFVEVGCLFGALFMLTNMLCGGWIGFFIELSKTRHWFIWKQRVSLELSLSWHCHES